MAVSTIPMPIAWHVNPNLLDNWYFVGGGSQQGGGQFPINHNGESTYAGVNGVTTIDSWKAGLASGASVSVTPASDGLRIVKSGSGAGNIAEYLEANQLPAGQKATISAIVSSLSYSNAMPHLFIFKISGGAASFLASVPVSSTGMYQVSFTVPSGAVQFCVGIGASGLIGNGASTYDIKVTAIKLELGNAQTLCHKEGSSWVLNEIPNYQQELVKSQSFLMTKTAQYSPNSGGYMNMPDGVTADNLISVFVTVTGSTTGNDSFVAIPSFVNTTGISSNTNRCYIYKASDMSLVTSLPFNTVTVTFVYQG